MNTCLKNYLSQLEATKARFWNDKKDKSYQYMEKRIGERLDRIAIHTSFSKDKFNRVSSSIMSAVMPMDSDWFTLTTYGSQTASTVERNFDKRNFEESLSKNIKQDSKKARKELRATFKSDIQLLSDTDGALDFLEYCTQVVLQNFRQNGYYYSKSECVKDAIICGVGFLATEEDIGEKEIRYTCLSPFECVYEPDGKGNVSTFGRRWTMRPIQMLNHYGYESLPEIVKQALKNKNITQEFNICELIYPTGSLFDENMNSLILGDEKDKYQVAIWCEEESDESSRYIYAGSTNTMPVTATVYERDGNNPYGIGLVESAIDSIVDLDQMELERQIIRKRNANPAWAVPSSLGAKKFTIRNNSINVIPDMSQAPTPIQMPDPYSEYTNDIEAKKQEIVSLLFVDVFQTLLASEDTRRTATEINMRKSESAQMMQQAIGNLELTTCSEVMHTLSILFRQRKIVPPKSEAILKLIPNITMLFSSSFIRMKNSYYMAEGNVSFLNYIVQLANIYPDVFDVVDMDEETRMIAVAYGQSQYAIREKSEVERIRQQKAELAQMQLQQQQMLQQSEIEMNNARAQIQGE